MRKTLATAGAALALVAGLAAPASAGSWIPDTPSSPQKVGGVGSICLKVDRGWYFDIYRWLTPSLTGKSSCEKVGWAPDWP